MGASYTDRADASPVSAEQVIAEARRAFFVMFGGLALVWVLQLVNYADHYALSRDYGIRSGDIGTLPDILLAPLLH